ncbi:MAG: M28 family peptidase [Candidatus Hydrogenedentes bacterium]|nr:M28 family peptidase [Candidatus Hydrogenedentota bacterium]
MTDYVGREEQLRRDVEFLAGRLPHRRANTDNERVAAEYLEERFKEYTIHATTDDFHSIDTFAYLLASYYIEFLVVAVVAIWAPWFALFYGVAVFVMYMAEFTGYRAMSRFLPQFETQNVTARFLSPNPKRLLVIASHYDSASDTQWSRPERLPWLRAAHYAIVLAMLVVALTCAVEAGRTSPEAVIHAIIALRWIAVLILIGAAATLYIGENTSEPTRGANANASGVATLLALAERFSAAPLKTTDVLIVATGSKESGLNGMWHLCAQVDVQRQRTYFLNLSCVGTGTLRYITGEGMMSLFKSSKKLVGLARGRAEEYQAAPLKYRGLPTDALIPLVRGYKTLGIMATGEDGLPQSADWPEDRAGAIDYGLLNRAADYAESIIRDLDNEDEDEK